MQIEPNYYIYNNQYYSKFNCNQLELKWNGYGIDIRINNRIVTDTKSR